jgi:hypothetical protein
MFTGKVKEVLSAVGQNKNVFYYMTRLAATLAVCLSFWVTLAKPPEHNSEPVFVGLIEDDRRELAKKSDSEPAVNRVVMPAFVKSGSEWKTIPELKKQIKWTVAFDGRSLGEVESRPDSAHDVIVQPNPVERSKYVYSVHAILTPPVKIPTVGQPGGKFDGVFGGKVRRPLVVVSQPNVHDPDRWKRVMLPTELMQPLRASFRNTYSHIRKCDKEGEPRQEDWVVPDDEINVVGSYGSMKGSFLAEMQLKHHECVFNKTGKEFVSLARTQWFYVDPEHVAHSLGIDLQLVDAGDYDGDGNSEVIFFLEIATDWRKAISCFSMLFVAEQRLPGIIGEAYTTRRMGWAQ